MRVERAAAPGGREDNKPSASTYRLKGAIFFASAERFADAFDFKEVIDHVVLDLSDAHFWDITGVGTLDKAVIRFRRAGTSVELVGLNEPSAAMVERFAIHDKPGAEKLLAAH